MILLTILFINSFLITSIYSQIQEQNHFWITGDVLSIQWKRGCLSSERCTNPRFQINAQLIDDPDIQRLDFPLSTANSRKINFNNYFPKGRPELLMLSMKVVGIDPLYNIPLDCDKTINIRAFDIGSKDNFKMVLEDEEDRPSIIELQAKCFTAVIQIKKYESLCPWCPKPEEVTNESSSSSTLPVSLALGQLEITQTTFYYIMSGLLLAIILSTMAIVFLFVRQRKLVKCRSIPSAITIYPPSRPSSKTKIGIYNDDGCYETIDDIEHFTPVIGIPSRVRTPSSGYPSSQNSSTSIYNHQHPDINILANYI
uniref:C2 domain-containing protein n=1 Tax=Parastrongyloides trichosuri TaxID=131310 RepID=A0A0N4Z790_PARTI